MHIKNTNPFAPAALEDPYPVLARLREAAPIVHCAPVGSLLVTRYAEVRAALSHPSLSSDTLSRHIAMAPSDARDTMTDVAAYLSDWPLYLDRPRHPIVRSLLKRALSARSRQSIERAVVRIVDELLDRVADDGEMDLIRDLAQPLPVVVVAGFFGIDLHECDRLKRWSDGICLVVAGALRDRSRFARARTGLEEMSEYLRWCFAKRRAEPGDDFLTSVLHDEDVVSGKVSEAELASHCTALLVAGHETTTHLLGNGMLALLNAPAQLRRLADNPALLPTAVEELLRYDSPVAFGMRVVKERLLLFGTPVAAGDTIIASIHAANRDPRQFEDPDRLDVGRQPNHHVVFGSGPHFCLGAGLARVEGAIAFRRLLRRFINIRRHSQRAAKRLALMGFRGLESLPLQFERRTA